MTRHPADLRQTISEWASAKAGAFLFALSPSLFLRELRDYTNPIMRTVLIAIAIALAGGLLGWNAKSLRDRKACDFLSGDIPSYHGYLSALNETASSKALTALPQIYACYASHPIIKGLDKGTPVLRLKDGRHFSDGRSILAFELWGLADDSLLVVVDQDGSPQKSNIYPYTLP